MIKLVLSTIAFECYVLILLSLYLRDQETCLPFQIFKFIEAFVLPAILMIGLLY